MKRCNHVRRSCRYHGENWGKDGNGYSFKFVTLRCIDCDAVLPLGPATMTPDVEVEVRAAEISEFESSGRTEESVLQPRDGWQFGWWLHLDEERGPEVALPVLLDGTHYNAAYLAFYPGWPCGWLARQIATHDGGDR